MGFQPVQALPEHLARRPTSRMGGMLERARPKGSPRGREVRLVPFFFEFEEADRKWLPVTAPDALTALTYIRLGLELWSAVAPAHSTSVRVPPATGR